MKRLFMATCIVGAFAVGLAAQTTGSTGSAADRHTAQATSGQTESQGARTMTVTGCLRQGETAGSYVLTNVEGMGRGRRGGADTGAGSGAASGTTMATGSGTGTGMGQGRGRGMGGGITLNAESGVDLSAHVGHKIEVTGTMTGGRMGAAGTSTTTMTGEAGGMSGSGTMMGRQGRGMSMRSMNVTSVKMVSETCGSEQ